MNIFLKAKHWQLFTILYGPVVIFYVVVMGKFFFDLGNLMANIEEAIANGDEPNPAIFLQSMFGSFKYFPFIGLLTIPILYGWYWSVVTGLQSKLPANLEIKTGAFKVVLFVSVGAVIYTVYMTYTMFETFTTDMTMVLDDPAGAQAFARKVTAMVGTMYPLQLAAMACMFYCYYIVAKVIKSAELRREATFSDLIAEFVLAWFFFVGVWILQPRINKLIEEVKA